MNLSPTPTRLALLAAVAEGRVHRYGDGLDYQDAWRKCSAAMELMQRAGWVALSDETEAGHKRPWVLTDAGEQIRKAVQ